MAFPRSSEQDFLEKLAGRIVALEQEVRRLGVRPSGAGLELLDKTELSAVATTVTFASIPGTYAALKIVAEMRTDRAATDDALSINFNNDAGNNYDYIRSSISHSASLFTTTGIGVASILFGGLAGNTAPANTFSGVDILIPAYAGSNHKTAMGGATKKSANAASNIAIVSLTSFWRSTAEITEIDLTPQIGTNFLSGSKFYLYGMSAIL